MLAIKPPLCARLDIHQRQITVRRLTPGPANDSKVLVIDERGYLPLDAVGATIFFQPVSARYERGSSLLTSNQSYGEWGSVGGDPVIATAILDRLLPPATTGNIRGESDRRKERRKAGLLPSRGHPGSQHRGGSGLAGRTWQLQRGMPCGEVGSLQPAIWGFLRAWTRKMWAGPADKAAVPTPGPD